MRRRPRHHPEFGRKYALIGVWLGTIVLFAVLRPTTFATFEDVQVIAGSQAVLVILTMGLLIPFTAGEFDLSIAGVLSVALVLVGWLNVIQHWPIWAAVAAALAVGLIIGLIHAVLVVGVGLESIVVTLGSGTLLIGVGIGVNSATTGGISNSLVSAVSTDFLGIPLAFYYGLVVTAVLWYVLVFTPLGRYMYFVGAGREVARLSGIRVDAIRALSLVASSVVSAGAGVLLAGWLGAADPNIASPLLLPAFAGVFLGATAITPGRFNPWGSFVAVYFLVTGVTGLELLGVASWVDQVFYGGALIVAVVLSHLAGIRRQAAVSRT